MDCDDFEKTLKVIVVGNGNVGKTSMTTRYAKGKYTGNYKKTIGVDFMEKSVELRDLGETVNLMIWDTAGQEEFDALTSRYYKGAGAVIYVFSTVDRDSFDDLPKWKRKVEEECGRICQVLVQNKIDLSEDAAMSRAEIEDMADYMNIRLFRSCVQDNVNVKEVFEHLCRQFLKYGGSGGSDDNLNAVADINSLSDLAANSDERGSSLHHHHHNSHSGLKDSEKKPRREILDLSSHDDDSSSSSLHRGHRQLNGSRAPGGKAHPPSVPATIAKEREKNRAFDNDEYDDVKDDEDQRRDRRQQRRDRRDDDDEEDDRRSIRRGDKRGENRHGDRSKARSSSSKTSAPKSKYSAPREEEEPRQSAEKVDQVPQISSNSHLDKENADETEAERGIDVVATRKDGSGKPRNAQLEEQDYSDEEGGERAVGDVHPSANFKLQPSKRRTNGKKRQSVPECMLS